MCKGQRRMMCWLICSHSFIRCCYRGAQRGGVFVAHWQKIKNWIFFKALNCWMTNAVDISRKLIENLKTVCVLLNVLVMKRMVVSCFTRSMRLQLLSTWSHGLRALLVCSGLCTCMLPQTAFLLLCTVSFFSKWDAAKCHPAKCHSKWPDMWSEMKMMSWSRYKRGFWLD